MMGFILADIRLYDRRGRKINGNNGLGLSNNHP